MKVDQVSRKGNVVGILAIDTLQALSLELQARKCLIRREILRVVFYG